MAEIIKKPVIAHSLLTLKVGEEMKFEQRLTKPYTVRGAAVRLKRKGYLFKCEEGGLPSGIKVTRIK